jgi:hypothetical protein
MLAEPKETPVNMSDTQMTPSALCIADRIASESISKAPFPHLVLQDVLPAELADSLLAQFPEAEAFGVDDTAIEERTRIYALANDDLESSPLVGGTIKTFCNSLRQPEFAERIVEAFASEIQRVYPGTNLAHLKRNMRASAKINLTVPDAGDSVVARGPHLDNPATLFTLLIYLRRDEDQVEGGDLQLYELLDPDYRFANKGRDVPLEDTRVCRTIPYRHNVAVVFMNAPNALHGVSRRRPTPIPRTTISFALHLPTPLYEIRRRQETGSLLVQLGRRLKKLGPAFARG